MIYAIWVTRQDIRQQQHQQAQKKRSKPTKMIECAFFGREKKPMRRGPIWQIWWGHTPGS